MANLNDFTTTPKVFLTDYNSYNNGTQFEFGHWVELDQFSDEDDFFEYVREHFAEADKKSPLYGTREEIMLTDFEGFPKDFYCECASTMKDIFIYLNLDEDEKVKIEYLTNHLGYDMENAISKIDEVYMQEDYTNIKYDLFEQYFPEADNIYETCPFVTFDYDQFLEQYFNEFEAENGNTYFFQSV